MPKTSQIPNANVSIKQGQRIPVRVKPHDTFEHQQQHSEWKGGKAKRWQGVESDIIVVLGKTR